MPFQDDILVYIVNRAQNIGMYSIYINKMLWDTQTKPKTSLTGRKLKKLICCTDGMSRTVHRAQVQQGKLRRLSVPVPQGNCALALVPGIHHAVSVMWQSRRHCQHPPGRPPTSDSLILRVLPPSVMTRLCWFAVQQA